MGIILWIMSVIAFLASLGLYRDGHRLEAALVFLACAVLVSAIAIADAINSLAADMAKDLAKRFPRTPVERMVADYEKHGGE
jgi:hypothetical protein